MTTFEQAMFARDRTLAIRVGAYQSSDIKEANFKYGYIAGDTFKPGGTCAGTGKITFTRIITGFKKLDKIYPEIGLLVDGAYEWVKMGEYYVNDIHIERNRNLTTLDLMDGMFKLNQPWISDLAYPAQIRDVIREICAKTGVELQNDNFGLRAIQHHVQEKPTKKDITFREVLSQAVQLLGFSAFFNRDGKLEIRGLTESNIMITADSYFLHGLTKSEAIYQIAGITCKKKDKEVLTVGLRTGRSLELENSFMIQNILDDLYFDLKNIKYYPFNLKYQGHLKLQVGQWVSIKTNKNEIFKVPVLNQSFTFKGGLSSTISADSKAGNDTQYSYKGFLTKKIEQVSTDLNAEVQQQLELAEQEFNQKTDGIKQEVETGIKKAQSEAKSYSDTLNQEMGAKVSEVNRIVTANKAEQDHQIRTALTQAGTADNLAKQAQQLSQRASEELRTIKAYVDNEGQRRELLEQYVRTETTSKVEALRTSINQNYIGKNQYTEDVKGITRRFEMLNISRRNLLQGTRLLSKYNPFDEFNGYKIARSVAGPTGYRDTYSDVMTTAAIGKEYVAVFYARASHDNYQIRCHMYNPNTGTTVETSTGYNATNNADGMALVTITKEWKAYWVKWGQNPTDKPRNLIIGRHGVQLGGIDGAWVEICAPALFEGNIVGTHEDAPEDAPNRNYVLNSGNTTIAEQLGLSSDLIKDLNQERTFTMSVEVEGANVGPNPANKRKRYGFATTVTFTDDTMWYPEVWETVDSPLRRIARTWTIPSGKIIKNINAVLINDTNKTNIVIAKPKLELGKYMTQWEETAKSFAEAKLAEYAQTIDGRFTNFASQYVSKTDFQKVQETSKLYERILGSTENDLTTKVSRLVMSNQLFQTEVSKYVQTGPNLIQNSNDPQNTEGWGAGVPGENPIVNIGSSVKYYSGQKKFFSLTNGTKEVASAASSRFRVKRNTTYTLNFKAYNSPNLKGFTIYFLGRSTTETQNYSVVQKLGEGKGFSNSEFVSQSYTFNSGQVDNAFLRFDNIGYTSGSSSFLNFTEIDLYEGEIQRPWQQSPEETDAISSKVTQLAGSYSIQNINSAADLISGLNLGANGVNRLTGKLTHITNETLLDNAVIKSAMVDKLKTANFESGSVTTSVLASNSVTAEKLVVDQALFNKLTTNEAYLKQLFAQSAFIAQVRSITLSATQILGGVLKALNNAMHINLNDGQILFYTDQAALKRELKGYPTQFIKFATGEVDDKGKIGVTVIGSNRGENENSNDGGFVGIRAWNGPGEDSMDLVGDELSLTSSAYIDKDGWVVNTLNSGLRIYPRNSSAGRNSRIEVGDVWILKGDGKYSSLRTILNTFNENFSKGPDADTYSYYPNGF